MSYRTDRRRRQITSKGRLMHLMRADSSESIGVMAYAPPPQTAQLFEGVAASTFIAQITTDETSAASFAPMNGDILKDGEKEYTLTEATPVYDRQDLCGWTLVSAGGN